MLTKRSKEGSLLIDHRSGPGLPPDFARKIGLSGPSVGNGASYESATITCHHCNAVVILNPLRTRPRGYCRKCDGYVCDNPACNEECNPFDKKIDALQEQAFRSNQRS